MRRPQKRCVVLNACACSGETSEQVDDETWRAVGARAQREEAAVEKEIKEPLKSMSRRLAA
jgi:hypothetical protein